MQHILFRCDSSSLIGSGHVIRCRTLARLLQKRGVEITFICRRQPGDLISLLKQEFNVLELPWLPLINSKFTEGRELYSSWLGCSQYDDFDDCLRSFENVDLSGVTWLVVDHYALDHIWEKLLINAFFGMSPLKLCVIDDLADRSHCADLLVDQNFYADRTHLRYSKLVPDYCNQLLGPHYSLLGPEYAQFYSLVPPRLELKRVLIYFGGLDTFNLTPLVLKSLSCPEFENLAVDVILGSQSSCSAEVQSLSLRRPFTTLHESLPSLAALIARADLAIGAGGSTTWERACLGLPSLVISVADNQVSLVKALDSAGQLQYLGSARDTSITVENVRKALFNVITDRWPRPSGRDLTDGWGASRVSTCLLGSTLSISLRLAVISDEFLLLRWANDPQVRANSCSIDKIEPVEHRRWFESLLSDQNRILFIVFDDFGCPIGQIRFERSLTTDSNCISEVFISLSLDSCVRGHGLASLVLRHGLRSIQTLWGKQLHFVANIFTFNAASEHLFANLGFTIDSNRSHNKYLPRQLRSWCLEVNP